MTLQVAHKVIIGFAIVLLLLLLASISSISILSGIDDAAKQVDEHAIPVKDTSTQLQVSLLKQVTISLSIPTSTSIDSVQVIDDDYVAEGVVLKEKVDRLSSLLTENKTKTLLKQFKEQHSEYDAAISTMLSDKRKIITNDSELVSLYQLLNTQLDTLEEALIDLSYIEDEDSSSLGQQIGSMAVQIEGYIINLTDTVNEISTLSTVKKVDELTGTIELAVTNIEQLFVYLERLSKDHISEERVKSVITQFTVIKKSVITDKAIILLKKSQLSLHQQLLDTYASSKVQANRANQQIEQILVIFNDNFERLQARVFDNVTKGQTSTIVILIVVIIAGIGIAIATIRAMIVPLKRINKVLSYIAKGDLSRQLTVTSDDEYGALSKNVNLVVEDLRRLIGEISSNAHLLNSSAIQSNEEISTVADTLSQQKKTVEDVTDITSKLDESADHILERATSTEQEMSNAIKQSSALETLANTTNKRIEALVEKLNATESVMTVLQNEATNIGGILETIQSISDQTNLLALNAAIEAARAGEAGRGFAVVADEVRLLASRTQESTSEINDMIDALQTQTDKAVADIGDGKNEANSCQTHTNELLETLTLINTAIEQIHTMSLDISTAARQQNNLSSDINTRIADVVKLSEFSSDKSLSTLSHGQHVVELAQQLDKSVDQFTIEK